MIAVQFRTSLDCLQGREIWPRKMPAPPTVGLVIESGEIHYGTQLRMRVATVVYRPFLDTDRSSWVPGEPGYYEVELVPNVNLTVTEFERYYRRLCDGTIQREIEEVLPSYRRENQGIRSAVQESYAYPAGSLGSDGMP